MSTEQLGFLQLFESENVYIGAILLTDLDSVPVEFRVTLPVRPTSIQRTLYGRALAPYIGVELCGKLLLEKVTQQPELIFVKPDYMLGLRPGSNVPLIYIQQTTTAIEEASGAANTVGKADQNRLELSEGHSQPVTLFPAPGFTKDLNVVRPLVEQLWPKFDLREPFDRIEQTLILLKEQDPRFSQ